MLKPNLLPIIFEIKFIDSTGNNVWWVNNRNYDFPKDGKKFISGKDISVLPGAGN